MSFFCEFISRGTLNEGTPGWSYESPLGYKAALYAASFGTNRTRIAIHPKQLDEIVFLFFTPKGLCSSSPGFLRIPWV